MVIDVF